MRALAVVILSVLLITCLGQLCDNSAWSCTGGDILTVKFQDDDEGTITQSDQFCTLIQDGSYSIDDNDRTVTFDFTRVFDLFDCQIINEEDNRCTQECYDRDVEFTFNDGGCQLFGPNGEVCDPATPTADCDSRTCPQGQVLVPDPNSPPGSNGCGPASIPFSAPSFSFEQCCNQHDICYGGCNTISKKQCDDEFYACMYCSCYAEYDDITVQLCLELACSYYQLVDEFGCDAFQASQTNGCMCDNQKDLVRTYVDVPSKWGPENALHTRLFCNAPDEPADCPGTNTITTVTSVTNSGTNSGTNSATNSATNSNGNSNSGSSNGNMLVFSFVLLFLTACFTL